MSSAILAESLVKRGYKNVEPLHSVSGSASIFRVYESEEYGAEPYVAKVVSLIALDAKARASAQQEVSLLKGLSAHPNLIAYRQSFMEEPGNLYIVMSLADGGDLRCVVTECMRERQTIPDPIVFFWTRQVLSGLVHLHGQGVIHRDLKSSNIFLSQKRRRILIGDFGISRVLESTAFAASCVGTPAYMSPELMRNERYDFHVDMWALGVICFELSALRLPFASQSLLELACQIMDGEPEWSAWLGASEEFRLIAQRLLSKEADLRPSAAELFSQPFYSDGGTGARIPQDHLWACISSHVVNHEGHGDDASSYQESSAHLSRLEFAELLATHSAELLNDLQTGARRSEARALPTALSGSASLGTERRAPESVI